MAFKNRYENVRVSQIDMKMFGKGIHETIYKKLGAHPVVKAGVKGIYFALWAPAAKEVFVIGDFNDWDETAHSMERLEPLGIYELFVPRATVNSPYKYMIVTKDYRKLYKADPFANYAELPPKNTSVVVNVEGYEWQDGLWMEERKRVQPKEAPIAVYEVHPGSWRRHFSEEERGKYYSYKELAHALADYVKEMGYTHVELMGIAEHPFDGSWGYQVTGYYAPTSRYGTPEDFQYFVDYMHQEGIGVILDWVPAHFAKDAHGLAEFDGSSLFEYANPKKGEHAQWGTKIFDYGKNQVQNFLIANALYWLEEYHIDGLRVDAVAAMLYSDHGNAYYDSGNIPKGENQNWEAVQLLRRLNDIVKEKHPSVMMIAEESSAWSGVTKETREDGLGFTFKWNMGWMHDFLEYMKLYPSLRKEHHNQMNFAMSYHYSENYMLVLSHDEVVHLKCSMLNKMPGCEKEKFANLRVGYAFMMGHPGKKLLFMGQEFGQSGEWCEARELAWDLLDKETHRQLQRYFKRLLTLYRQYPAMYELDYDSQGFYWINADDKERSIYSFVRQGKKDSRELLFICNFSDREYANYRVGVPKKKDYKLILNGDALEFGGNGKEHPSVCEAEEMACDGQKVSISFDLSPYGVAVFEF